MRRNFSKAQREALIALANYQCEKCGIPITINNFHADHVIPYSLGGQTVIYNGQALCSKCNLNKGNDMLPKVKDKTGKNLEPRKWQREAFSGTDSFKGIAKSIADGDKSILLNVCPGGGKTNLGVMVAKHALGTDQVDKVLIVSPRGKIRDQWQIGMTVNAIVTENNLSQKMAIQRINTIPNKGLSMTYQLVNYDSISEYVSGICARYRTLVILDEIHWTGESNGFGNSWGRKLVTATERAKFCLALSGTPFREDHYRIPFLTYVDGQGAADYNYSYEQALSDGVVTPIYFRDRDGRVLFRKSDAETGEILEEHELDFEDGVYYTATGEVDEDRMNMRLNAALHPTSEYWRDIMDDAIARLDWLREHKHPKAGGIVFAVDQNHARSIASYIAQKTGKNPHVIISDESSDIDAFASSNEPWVVSVKMISEGVDIERLRVGAMLTNITTRKNFMQSVARCIRLDYENMGADNWSQEAYIFMPQDPRFLEYALKFKEAIADEDRPDPKTGTGGGDGPQTKREYIVDSSSSDDGGLVFGEEYWTADEIRSQAEEIQRRVDPELLEKIGAALTEEQRHAFANQLMRDQRMRGDIV